MSSMRKPGPEPFLIQYTDDARHQLSLLDNRTCTSVQEKLSVVAASDPHAHGRPDPPECQGDRRSMHIEGLVVTFWISRPVRLLTVVRIAQGDDGCTAADSTPPALPLIISPRRPGSFGADAEEDEIMIVPSPRASTP